ncbi:ABC transporter ATP-binding protein [Chelatococcus asaccharovorans]|uniref:Putative spermidine/putrescine transport system ATP-binding protein n=1 Tax=Chelatococcus asaccharovorans TaxID=28210 RepID=A0A2V3TSM9_9HYPH|nr:ABC transporter ATP-binding protein [Chelatococcus asaccharovorans]MBS7707843.1 ABC transporter ATP-binding protein [Chelatococcus asaccharovorans]PXW50910.1 putative spermidine/putrescine transport system ATP-binding protein [Chelatococcus asaccharovorans]
MAALELFGLTKRYGDVAAVAEIDLSVDRGAFVSLLGPSGCGKTTTLQMIAGLVEATAGRIELDGTDVTRLAPNRRGLGIVFQAYALFPHMTVARNVAFGLEMRKVPRAEIDRRVSDALGLVKLNQYADRYPRQLSGGQKQRVALARALVIAPPVLLLDEPLSNLDAKLREEMQFELRRIQQTVGTTTIMVTHDQSEALSISDRVIVMESGKITQADTPFSLYEHPRNAFISGFVGKANLLEVELACDGSAHVKGIAVPSAHGTRMGRHLMCLRPEKVRINDPRQGAVPGTVTQRFFLGSQWMYEVTGPLGPLMVLTANNAGPSWDIDQPVSLSWDPTSLRVVSVA